MSETLYPIQVDVKIYVTDGKRLGSVTYGFPAGKTPNEERIRTSIEKSLENLPDGYRLITKHETFNHYLREEKGYHGPQVIIPVEGDWHDPKTADIHHSSLFPSDDDFEEE